jgi:uncharacterized integral membrane protein
MLAHLPITLYLLFGLTTIATLYLFYKAVKQAKVTTTSRKANLILMVLSAWLILQGVLTIKGVYNTDTSSIPPKIILFGIAPMIVTIILLFATTSGRQFIDSLPLKYITWLHTIRIPVELALFWLYIHQAVPELMTFEGRNWDILAGITAPFVAYFGCTKNVLSTKLQLTWNLLCLGLLINIVVFALLSAPSPFQKFAFDHPNIAVVNFPFSWLPTFIVPVVLFCHLTAIRQLIRFNMR